MVLTNVNVDTKRDVGWPSKHSTGIDYLTKWNFFLSNPMTNVDNNHSRWHPNVCDGQDKKKSSFSKKKKYWPEFIPISHITKFYST